MEAECSRYPTRKQRRKQRFRKSEATTRTLAWQGRCCCHGLVGKQCRRRIPAEQLEMAAPSAAMDCLALSASFSRLSRLDWYWVFAPRQIRPPETPSTHSSRSRPRAPQGRGARLGVQPEHRPRTPQLAASYTGFLLGMSQDTHES